MKIFELPQTNPLSANRTIPNVDSRGFHYKDFETMKPEDSKLGDAGFYVGIKATCVYHSQTERIALHFLDFNTRVLTMRTHYPYYEEERFAKKYLSKAPIWRKEVATIDIDILYENDDFELAQHGVSCKDKEEEFLTQKVVRRSARDHEFYAGINGTWEPVVKNYFARKEYDNYEFILKHIRKSNVLALNEEALIVSQLWKKRGLKRPMDSLLEPFARKIGTDKHHLFRLTCVAIFLGHLRLDHKYEFNLRTPLRLRPDGVYQFSRGVETAPWGF
ncbi:MAG: hypothetical protein WCA85_15565 [Paraburkholderia sp.]|uniref:hypothetical protein n=1 Tax=Paraburkholderia sp. TaxID=1926495 RepID=UPI003C490444